MTSSHLRAISPIDGRYASKLSDLQGYYSEFALQRYRLLTEIRWLECLSDCKDLKEVSALNPEAKKFLHSLFENFSLKDAERIKHFEAETHHDVKAVEYFLQEKISQHSELSSLKSFIHFACTSEDINNVAYALTMKDAREKILSPRLTKLIATIQALAHKHAEQTMLAHTHGQAASPTTLGKEFSVFEKRLQTQHKSFVETAITAKFNGATGNYHAHSIAYPEIDWPSTCQQFIESLSLDWNSHTTQIESHDQLADLMQAQIRINNILIDFSRDIWQYISLNYLQEAPKANEVGSSVMPHKINPIHFENAEGNLGLANALFSHLSNKLPISRLQRDLSDSTALRNLGTAFAHTDLAYQALMHGLGKLSVNKTKILTDLEAHWEVLTEAIQTVLRSHGHADAYEQLKTFSRGKTLTKQDLQGFINTLSIPEKTKKRLLALTPSNYTGYAAELAKGK